VLCWAVLGSLWSIAGIRSASGRAWPSTPTLAYAAVLVCAGLLASLLLTRRVDKMRPRIGRPLDRRRSTPVYALIATAAFVALLAALGLRQYVEAVLLASAGGLCWAIGERAQAVLYRHLGGVAAAAAVLLIAIQGTAPGTLPSLAGIMIYDAVLVGFAIPTGFVINRRYLWSRFE